MSEELTDVKVKDRRHVMSRETISLLDQIDTLGSLRKELRAVKTESHKSIGSLIDDAMSKLNAAAERLRTVVGERVVADWTGVEVKRKF